MTISKTLRSTLKLDIADSEPDQAAHLAAETALPMPETDMLVAEPYERDSLSGIALPSVRMAIVLGAVLFVSLALVLFTKAAQESDSRRIETELTQNAIATKSADMVSALRTNAAMTGTEVTTTQVKRLLTANAVGEHTAVYDISADRTSYIAAGAVEGYVVRPTNLERLNLSASGVALFDREAIGIAPFGKVLATWRPMEDGRVILALSPAADIHDRVPVWTLYGLAFLAICLIAGSMVLAFLRQARAIQNAGLGLRQLGQELEQFSEAGCGHWSYDKITAQLTLPASLMSELGFEHTPRICALREATAIVHPKDARGAIALWSGNETQSARQFRLRTAENDWQWVLASVDAQESGAGGLILPIGQTALGDDRLTQVEARMKDAIESIPEAFLLWDEQGRLTAWNGKFCNICRIPPTRLTTGMTVSMIAEASPDPSISRLITRNFSPPVNGSEQSVEVELPGNRWGHVARRRTAENGWVCIITNVTDMKRRAKAQKRKERELEMTVERLEQSQVELRDAVESYEREKLRAEEANRSKSEFLANMSHELRTPLNAINGFSEVMQSELYGALGHAKYAEYVNDILQSGRHLLALIDDVLDMSKIEAGRMELEIGPVDLERILQEGLRLVEPQTRAQDITLTASISSLPSVWADSRATKQVFINLLSNAVKFTQEGGSVSITAQADLDSITVLIADTGIGIEKDRLPKLGEPFELLGDHLSKANRGSGLGLALCKSLMELQHGILALASEANRGTVAAFTLPRRSGITVSLPALLDGKTQVLTKEPTPSPGISLAVANDTAAE
ncbi:PAS domain-containing sensor histidine kinase [Parvularcula sp. IMCC14364]|uniref:sensor histidine kinase n=1 Tax=Parvularcula sp. IMCC14364 TaxID=3067902 RepID=UPI0027418497|nr:PAS domain-containing sensor histidine kinase [Parvularcula sp. IMCC14364]